MNLLWPQRFRILEKECNLGGAGWEQRVMQPTISYDGIKISQGIQY
jgi:hypothetical protein